MLTNLHDAVLDNRISRFYVPSKKNWNWRDSNPSPLTSPPEWQALLPVRILQPYVVLENHSGGATRPRKKFDDTFIRFDTIPACDGRTDTLQQQ